MKNSNIVPDETAREPPEESQPARPMKEEAPMPADHPPPANLPRRARQAILEFFPESAAYAVLVEVEEKYNRTLRSSGKDAADRELDELLEDLQGAKKAKRKEQGRAAIQSGLTRIAPSLVVSALTGLGASIYAFFELIF